MRWKDAFSNAMVELFPAFHSQGFSSQFSPTKTVDANRKAGRDIFLEVLHVWLMWPLIGILGCYGWCFCTHFLERLTRLKVHSEILVRFQNTNTSSLRSTNLRGCVGCPNSLLVRQHQAVVGGPNCEFEYRNGKIRCRLYRVQVMRGSMAVVTSHLFIIFFLSDAWSTVVPLQLVIICVHEQGISLTSKSLVTCKQEINDFVKIQGSLLTFKSVLKYASPDKPLPRFPFPFQTSSMPFSQSHALEHLLGLARISQRSHLLKLSSFLNPKHYNFEVDYIIMSCTMASLTYPLIQYSQNTWIKRFFENLSQSGFRTWQ